MASIGWEGKRARILWRDSAKKKQTLRLGEVDRRIAETARVAVGHLLVAKRYRTVPHPDATTWLGSVDDVIHARAAALGLCQPREAAVVVTVDDLCKRFDAAATVKDGTRTTYAQACRSMREHFTPTKDIRTIGPADADNFKRWLHEARVDSKGKKRKALAPATVAKRVKVARAVFGKAVRWGLLTSNPFQYVTAGSMANADRAFYVDRGTIGLILDRCPGDEWRAIIMLARYAGLRCPSEHAGLRWRDVNWEKGTLLVRSPKTAGHGDEHAVRVVPIDDDLMPVLIRLHEAAPDGAEKVLTRVRGPGINLRTQLERIMEEAGITPWPRMFHNLRASCATDWVEKIPPHAVAKYLGHSPMIAATHYLIARDAHLDLAKGIGKSGTNPATQAHRHAPKGDQRGQGRKHTGDENLDNPSGLVAVGAECDSVGAEKNSAEAEQVTPMGFEPMSLP